jgi:large subunit ribosomal protein L18
MIKLKIRNKMASKLKLRLKRKLRGRNDLNSDGSADIPRMCVFKSNKYIYAQVINDLEGKVLVAVNSLQKGLKDPKKNNKSTEAAKNVGSLLAKKAKEAGIETVKFDRNGYPYKGRIKALADGAREGGLKF